MAEPILTVEHLIKAYGETPVLDDISFGRAIQNRLNTMVNTHSP